MLEKEAIRRKEMFEKHKKKGNENANKVTRASEVLEKKDDSNVESATQMIAKTVLEKKDDSNVESATQMVAKPVLEKKDDSNVGRAEKHKFQTKKLNPAIENSNATRLFIQNCPNKPEFAQFLKEKYGFVSVRLVIRDCKTFTGAFAEGPAPLIRELLYQNRNYIHFEGRNNWIAFSKYRGDK